MAAAIDPQLLKEPLLILASAAIVVPIFTRLKLSPALGFILVGMFLGPYGFGSLAQLYPSLAFFTITDPDRVDTLANLGVVFLMFMIGLELSFERLKAMRRLIFGLGLLQVVLCTAALAGILYFIGQPFEAAMVLGVALAQSSTVIVLQVLSEAKKLNAPVGRISFAILLFQDIAVVPIMLLVGLLAADTVTDGVHTQTLWQTVLPAVMVIPGILVAGRLLLRPWFRIVAQAKSPEYFMAACLLVVLATSVIAASAGLSMALGALLAGLLLAETEYRREIEITIEPFKGLLLGLFQLTVGMGIDLPLVASDPLPIISMAVGLICVKAVVIFLLCLLFRKSWSNSLQTALMIGPAGEFAFIILGLAMNLKIVSEDYASVALIVVTFTMAMLPLLTKLLPVIERSRKDGPVFEVVSNTEQRVVILGFGRIGQYIASQLDKFNIPYVAIDNDVKRVLAARDRGVRIFFSDARHISHVDPENLQQARALVVTIDAKDVTEYVVEIARKKAPNLLIVARANDAVHAQKLIVAGATDIVSEAFESGSHLTRTLLIDIGIAVPEVTQLLHDSRAEYMRRLREVARPEMSGHAKRVESCTVTRPAEVIIPQDAM